ncbi:plastid division protein PDV2-like [Cucurbita maxima]|uniref:Plastid division protein PDV2-like n=1 Tax=Cucurbita maxima TaxID=3661 RepID=A0A6J1JIG6_CUCMA|nr:plastid division protein PDV2-like [Cucurbita maxima]XP_022988872.1 plastid division protein PDV2-like [Cucurbita maxima]
MEEQGTAIILARATELRLKIRGSVNTTTSSPETDIRDDRFAVDENNGVGSSGEAEEEDEESVRLLKICDALASLENQLSSLQDLQQRQRYEKEVALSEIEHSRKIVLDKLKKYQGQDLEVIHEASAFVRETVQHNKDFMLPPYPSHPDKSYTHPFPSGHESVTNGLTDTTTNIATKELTESERKQSKSHSRNSRNSRNGLGTFASVAAKSVVTVVAIVSILHLTGLTPKFARKVSSLKVFNIFRPSAAGSNGSHNVCSPVEAHQCIVKERIEVPFSSAVVKPDVNYGRG